jgi:hypothetical protein
VNWCLACCVIIITFAIVKLFLLNINKVLALIRIELLFIIILLVLIIFILLITVIHLLFIYNLLNFLVGLICLTKHCFLRHLQWVLEFFVVLIRITLFAILELLLHRLFVRPVTLDVISHR